MANGETETFEVFVSREHAALLRFAVRLTGDRASAEDLLQQALVGTALRWSRITRRDDPGVYVRRCLVNARARAWRRGRRETLTAEPLKGSTFEGRGALGAALAGADAGLAERMLLRSALLSLPPRQRAVLVLRFYEDRSEADTAALRGCSRGTVKSQTSKALAALRTRIGREVPT